MKLDLIALRHLLLQIYFLLSKHVQELISLRFLGLLLRCLLIELLSNLLESICLQSQIVLTLFLVFELHVKLSDLPALIFHSLLLITRN